MFTLSLKSHITALNLDFRLDTNYLPTLRGLSCSLYWLWIGIAFVLPACNFLPITCISMTPGWPFHFSTLDGISRLLPWVISVTPITVCFFFWLSSCSSAAKSFSCAACLLLAVFALCTCLCLISSRGNVFHLGSASDVFVACCVFVWTDPSLISSQIFLKLCIQSCLCILSPSLLYNLIFFLLLHLVKGEMHAQVMGTWTFLWSFDITLCVCERERQWQADMESNFLLMWVKWMRERKLNDIWDVLDGLYGVV